jgi:hypothetical protein
MDASLMFAQRPLIGVPDFKSSAVELAVAVIVAAA